MDYFTAIQEGRKRVNEAMAVLQGVAGQCYPVLLLKLGITDWTPVGSEMMQQVVPGKNGMAALVICDADGNTKTMSTWVQGPKAEEYSRELEKKGVPVFPGGIKLPI
jgi:hypothetical protein